MDKLGVILSVGCMIHCMLMPILIPLLPAFGFMFSHNYWIHLVLAGVISTVAVIALILGRRKHGKDEPLVIARAGIIMLFAMAFCEYLGKQSIIITFITIFGSLLIAFAHYLNHRYLCACKHHGKH